jgi:hypothetical protein
MGLFTKYIDFKIFLFSLVFGLFAVYMTAPTMRKIYVYPSPENINLLQYKDKTDTCFSFQQKEMKCPSDSSKISIIPMQA